MSRKTNKVVEDNKLRFFDFYYSELDKFLLDYKSEETIKTIDEEFLLYFSNDEDIKGELDITVKKEPGKKIKSTVHQVFDNASRIDFENTEKVIYHLDKYFKFLIFIKKTNTDVFQLFSARRINNLFSIIQKYNINLYYSFKNSSIINELFSLIQKSETKLIVSLLECLAHITYTNMCYIRNYEYDTYVHISESLDSSNSYGSPSNNSSYINGKGIPLSTPHYSNQVNHSISPRHSSPLNNRSNIIQHYEKPPINTLMLLSKDCQEFYDTIIKFVYTSYSKCQFWMSRETYNISLHLLIINMELYRDTSDLITNTLQYFTKSTLLYNPDSLEWNINSYLRKTLNTVKQLMLFPSNKQGGSPTNKEKKKDLHWIFPLIHKLETSGIYTSSSVNYNTPGSNSLLLKNQILIIDGRNWFYHKDCESSNNINIKELQKYKNSDDFIKTVFPKLQNHFTRTLKTNITYKFASIIRCVFVFNDYHRQTISLYNPDMLSMCIFTPQQKKSNNDDIFCLYLWLSNPGSFLLSNDQYHIYADKLMGHQYYLGLWKHWTNCFQISK